MYSQLRNQVTRTRRGYLRLEAQDCEGLESAIGIRVLRHRVCVGSVDDIQVDPGVCLHLKGAICSDLEFGIDLLLIRKKQ